MPARQPSASSSILRRYALVSYSKGRERTSFGGRCSGGVVQVFFSFSPD